MLFNSFEFALFLALVLALYNVLPHRAQNRLLLVASYVFYGAWDWRFLGLIGLSTVIDFAVGRVLGRVEEAGARRRWVTVSIVANLAILGAFKYLGFFSESFSLLMARFGWSVPTFFSDVILPVGISFYTFQTLSYTIDVYRRRFEPTDRFLDFALFVAFFPQLVAGPIERASNLLPQISAKRRLTWERWNSGCWLIFWGIYKKVVVADNLAYVVNDVYRSGSDPTSIELLVGTYAFFFQLYCDFSGYTDVARGVARLLGFELMLNFDLPIVSRNITEFWNRWHISLGSWIRDYVFIPLGGSRGGTWRTSRNLMVMFLLVGLWHGAAWSFVLWGAFNGVMMVVHRLAAPVLARHPLPGRFGPTVAGVSSAFLLFHLNCFALLLFRATSLDQVLSLSALIGSSLDPGLALGWLRPLVVLVAPLLAMEMWQWRSGDAEVVLRSPAWLRTAIYLGLTAMWVFLAEDNEAPYVYFQF